MPQPTAPHYKIMYITTVCCSTWHTSDLYS